MANATKKIKEVKPLDLIIEIIDARAIKTSKNEELTKELNKPKMTIALKSDLTDVKTIKVPKDVIVGSIKDLSFKEKIIEQLYIFFQPKINSLKKRGLIVPQFYIMVVGLPNVGKSSIINFLGTRGAKAIVQNRPGVTRKNQMIKLNDNFFIYDTPGIMVKKITNVTQGYILALLNLIKREVLPVKEVSEWAFNFYKDNYSKEFFNYFTSFSDEKFTIFVDYLCERFKFKSKDGNHDKIRAMEYFLTIVKEGSICKVNYEK